MHDGKGIEPAPVAPVTMNTARISLLLSEQPNRIAIYRPRVGADLSVFDPASVQIIQGFRPDYDAFSDAGFEVRIEPEGEFDLAIVAVPRSKTEARALIADAASRASMVVVDGQKTDGIDSIARDIKKRGGNVRVESKSHGKAIAFEGGDFSDWEHKGPLGSVEGFETRLGVFSADRIDKGSQLLLEALPEKLPSIIADLGAGWGYLSRHILERDGVKALHLVEAEHAALECAKANVTDPRATFHWADATRFDPKLRFDGVIMNPPFHTTRAADPALGQAFISAAARLLAPHGQLWLVANRQLPYEVALSERFSFVEKIADAGGFKVLYAKRPLRTRA
ncbi:class I SAM-dependent methyltransferase [Celeribacter sp.]|uniref:class I SAM-dependent methyltransferase n=1 Tax=Celeribacter sp. TaxID=1890673 RepID=UPI003A919636